MEITARDLSRLIELNKKKAELEFKKNIFGTEDETLKNIISNAAELAIKVKSAKIELAIPNEKKLDELAKAIENLPPDALKEALKVKDGKGYQLLQERGLIVKRNYQNRMEIAKLSIIVAKTNDDERKILLDTIRNGILSEKIKVESIDDESVRMMAQFLQRCCIDCKAVGKEIMPSSEKISEVLLELPSRNVWISESGKVKLEENLKRIKTINVTIQLKNAERQIKNFSEEEENSFANLQKEYLELLKQQDELLREFNEEEKLSVKVEG